MAATGTFGSNIGGKASQRPKPIRTAPAGVLKLVVPHVTNAPAFHVPASTHVPASLLKAPTIDTSWGSLGSGVVNQGGNSNPLSEVLGGVEGFIGHLGSDVVHTALGMPAGIAYMFEHPIAGGEMAVKATWQDWSPLFHGDVRLWLHNTWEHPLAPILDVASVLTLGAAGSARVAAVAGRIGEAADAASAASKAAQTASAATAGATGAVAPVGSALAKIAPSAAGLVAPVRGTQAILAGARQLQIAAAGEAGLASGALSQGIAASEWWQKFQRYASPASYADKQYAKIADTLGYTGDAKMNFVDSAMGQDSIARRIYDGPGGTQVWKPVSDNPWTRVRQAKLRTVSNKLANASGIKGKIPNMLGDEATARRLLSADKGIRRAAMGNIVHRQLVAMHDAGETLSKLLPHEYLAHIDPAMYKGLVMQAHVVKPLGAIGSDALKNQLKELGDAGLQAVRDPTLRTLGTKNGLGINQALQNVITKGDKGVDQYLHSDWSTASVTNHADEVMLDGQGNLRIVSRPEKIGQEVQGSSKVMQLLYTNPTAAWKYLILGASPRYFVNNFVGNTLMLMAATDPVSMVRAFGQYLKTSHGMNAVFENEIARMTAAGATHEELAMAMLGRKIQGGHWMDKWFGGEYGFGESNRIHPGGLEQDTTGTGWIGTLNSKYSLHRITNKYADMPQRYAALNYSMHRMPEFQRHYADLRARGYSHFHAEQAAAEKASSSAAVRMIVRQQVHHMLGQYHTFSKTERGIRTLVPFYAWDRAIAVHMHQLIVQAPYKVAMGAAIGSIGQIKLQEIMGQTPDFLQSAIPAKLMTGPLGVIDAIMGQNGTRMNALMGQGLNPYASVADLTKTVGSILPGGSGQIRVGESLGGQLNPLIRSAAEELSGTSLVSGGPRGTSKLDAFGPIAGIYLNAFGGTPQFNILQAALGMEGNSMTKKGNPTLYSKNLQAQVSGWLGLPLRQVDIPTANKLAQVTDGKKHKKNTMSSPLL